MREIKFKAWDKSNKKFILPVPDLVYWSTSKIDKKNKSFEIDSIETSKKDLAWSINNNLILLQFTGLKDKHGKEIYEGDIIRKEVTILGTEEMRRFTFKIYFEWGQVIGEGLTEDALGKLVEKRPIRFPSQFQVIGNIYENPELLGGNNE